MPTDGALWAFLGDQGVSWYEETTEDSSHGSLRSMCCERSMAPGEACHDVLLGFITNSSTMVTLCDTVQVQEHRRTADLMAAFDAGQDQHLSSKDVSGSTSVESFVWGTPGDMVTSQR